MNINKSLVILGLIVSLVSCQKNTTHDMNVIPDSIPVYSPMKALLSFEDKIEDVSNYKLALDMSPAETFSFVSGVKGKALKKGMEGYVIIKEMPRLLYTDFNLKDTITNLDALTVSFWMNGPKNTNAAGLLSFSNKKEFWGNFDIFLENTSDDAFFKVQMRNGTKDAWVEVKVPGVFDNWVMMTFRYVGATSTMTIFKNGEPVKEQVITDFGKLKLNNLGGIVIGNHQFQTTPSLTTSHGKEGWAGGFVGLLDEFQIYNKALSNAEIKTLHSAK